MPSPSRQGSSMIMGRKASEHKERHEESKEDGPNNSTRKTSGLFSRMTQVFDFKPRLSSNQRAEATDPPPAPRQPSNSKRLMWGLKKSTPDLRKTSGGTFDAVPEMPLLNQRPENSFGRFTPPPESHLHIPKSRALRAPTRIPKSVSSTVARVGFSIGTRNIHQNQDLEAMVTVTVTADVHNVADTVAASTGRVDVPLDVLILVDTTDASTTEFLKVACKKVFHLTSTLDTLVDRIAIGSVSADPIRSLELVMPLGPCNFETISSTFYSLPILQFPNMEAAGSRLSDAIREASCWLLRQSSRGSLRQIFVLTPQSKISISDSFKPEMLRLHTLSPSPAVAILNSEAVYGWHIRTSFDEDADMEADISLKRGLKQLIGYLRLGMDPGVLSNVMVDLKGAAGTDVKACFADAMRRRLRPGESWSLCFQTVTSGSARVGEAIKSVNTERYIGGEYGEEVDVEEMIDEIQGMLGEQDICFENSLTATVEYGHSVYPNDTILKTTGKCDIPVIPPVETYDHESTQTVQRVEKFEEFDDDSDVNGGILRSRTGRGDYRTVKTKKSRFFSRNVDEDITQGHTEEELPKEPFGIGEAYPLPGPAADMSTERAATATPSGERSGLQTMNPYRALAAKASDSNVYKHRRH